MFVGTHLCCVVAISPFSPAPHLCYANFSVQLCVAASLRLTALCMGSRSWFSHLLIPNIMGGGFSPELVTSPIYFHFYFILVPCSFILRKRLRARHVITVCTFFLYCTLTLCIFCIFSSCASQVTQYFSLSMCLCSTLLECTHMLNVLDFRY